MAPTDTLSSLRPYAEELTENSYVQDNLKSAAANLRGAYERSQKRRVKAARDEKIRGQVQAAAASITEAGRALAKGRRKPEPRRGRRLALALVAAAVAGVALAANEQWRDAIFNSAGGGGVEADSPSPTGPPTVA